VVLVTVLIEESPHIADEEIVEVIEVIPGITRVVLHYGFMQYPTIYERLVLACKQGKRLASTSPTSSVPPRSSACRPGRWSSSGPRSRFNVFSLSPLFAGRGLG
jgi:K+ transporter